MPSLPAIPKTNTSVPSGYGGATLSDTTPILSTNLHLSNPLAGTTTVDPPGGDTPRTDGGARAPEMSSAGVDNTSDEVEVTPTSTTETTSGAAEPELAAETMLVVHPPLIPTVAPPPVSLCPIDSGKVPAFLRSHGTGNRRVDIFKYLYERQDPHFRQVLLHYINFEANDKSGANGSLPTTNRPPEIAQWTGRARPASLPDYEKAGRTFSTFVDSTLGWWGSIQPSWRGFERGVVSREIRGDWEGLRSPRINGLLNVVVLVYWWGRILEEHRPEGAVRADYEFFANDVAWVLSHLST